MKKKLNIIKKLNIMKKFDGKFELLKKKKNIVFITVAFLILVILIITLAKIKDRGMFEIRGGGVDTPLIYLNDDKQLKYCTFENQETHTLLGGVDFDANGIFLYQLKDRNKYSLLTTDGLYRIDKKDIDNIMKQVSGFKSYKINNNYFVYTLDNNLYVFDLNTSEKTKVDSGVESVKNITNKYYTYVKDGFEYLKSFDDKNIKAKLSKFNDDDTDTNIISISDVYNKVLYFNPVQDDDDGDEKVELVVYDIKDDKKDVITSDCDSVGYYSNDFKKIGYTEVASTKSTVYYIINYNVDIESVIKKIFNGENTINNYYTSRCKDNPNMYCYYMYDSEDDYVPSRTVELTNEEFEESSKLLEIYNNGDNAYDSINKYNVYFYDDGDSETLLEDVDYVDGIYSNKDVAYKKYSGNRVSIDRFLPNKCGDNCLTDISEAIGLMKYDIYYKKYDKDATLIEANTNSSSGITNDNGYKILSIYNNNRTEYLLEDKNDTLKKSTMLMESGLRYNNSMGYNYEGIFFFDNYNYEKQIGDLYLYRDGKKIHIADEIYTDNVMIKDDNVYYVENFDFASSSGTFSKYSIKKKKKEKIIDNINRVLYVEDNKYFVLKDYSSSSGTYDLYSYNKGKLNLIENSVKEVNWANFIG